MPPAETISLTVSPDEMRAVRESVEAGEHACPGEVLRAALDLWRRRREEKAERLDAIRARIRRSLDDPRPDLTGEEVQEHLDALFAEAERAVRRA